MKEVIKCSIAGVAFTLDTDAYDTLRRYLDTLNDTYRTTPDGPEIVADIEARIAEAENRGYMRGRNERIAELMRQPALFERQTSPSARDAPGGIAADSQGDSLPMILNNPRVSIWDR